MQTHGPLEEGEIPEGMVNRLSRLGQVATRRKRNRRKDIRSRVSEIATHVVAWA